MQNKKIQVKDEQVVSERGSFKNKLKTMMATPEIGVIIPFLILVAIIGSFRPVFFSANNLGAIFRSTAFYGIVAIGVTMVIIAGEIDISVGSVAGLGACLSSVLMMYANLGIIVSIIITLAACSLIGFLNGFLVARMKMSGFIVTISTLYIAKGIGFVITKGYPVYPLPKPLAAFGAAAPLGVSWAFIICIAMIIVADIIMRKTVFGRQIYAVGDNKEVAKLAGINVERVKTVTFVITSILSAFAGILVSAQLNTGAPQTGAGWEMQIIAGTAVGGISMLGGAGTMFGTIIGVFVLAVLTNGLILLGIDPQVQTITTGSVMVLAVLLDMVRRNRKLSAKG